MNAARHIPVMVDEVLQHLLHPGARLIVDGTVGFGGHTAAILRQQDDVSVIGVDRDPAAIAACAERFGEFGGRVRLVQGVYSDFDAFLGDRLADGILLDLGISSAQIQ
ncbi:MAG TPA: 16S rRNA (cytosine(1402)-N(4))-methyltransferase, partial [Candidatus Krumholzibacteria bacterium]|nr:16S rRNA (cytosine(1402)-N(4))-methyltransferase [Candidatus Krumholzibacteria bacterium]